MGRRTKKSGRGFGSRLKRLGLGVLGLTALALVIWYGLVPYPWRLADRNPERTALQEQRLEEAREAGQELEIRQEWVELDAISPRLVRAVITAEDQRFPDHDGVDWRSLAEEVRWTGDDDFSWTSGEDLEALADAFAYVWTHRDSIRGRSTITQQLAKNLWFGTDRSFVRKALELEVAQRLERKLSKDRIMELYLNVVEFGPGIFGAEAASQTYFGVSAADLSLSQAAALAGTLPHPLTSNPATNPGRMRWRRDLILQRLTGPPRAVPEPLPRPDVDMPLPEIEMPEPEAPPLPDAGAGGDDTGAPGDTVGGGAEPVRADSAAARPDTVGGPGPAGAPGAGGGRPG